MKVEINNISHSFNDVSFLAVMVPLRGFLAPPIWHQ